MINEEEMFFLKFCDLVYYIRVGILMMVSFIIGVYIGVLI